MNQTSKQILKHEDKQVINKPIKHDESLAKLLPPEQQIEVERADFRLALWKQKAEALCSGCSRCSLAKL
jgi:hypothetical protein